MSNDYNDSQVQAMIESVELTNDSIDAINKNSKAIPKPRPPKLSPEDQKQSDDFEKAQNELIVSLRSQLAESGHLAMPMMPSASDLSIPTLMTIDSAKILGIDDDELKVLERAVRWDMRKRWNDLSINAIGEEYNTFSDFQCQVKIGDIFADAEHPTITTSVIEVGYSFERKRMFAVCTDGNLHEPSIEIIDLDDLLDTKQWLAVECNKDGANE